MFYDSTNVLYKRLLGSSIIKKIGFISEKAKSHICRYYEIIYKMINLVFFT